MTIADLARNLLDHAAWADGLALEALERARHVSPKALRRLAHVAATYELWLARVEARPPASAVWPELTAAQTRELLERGLDGWRKRIERTGDREWSRAVSYVNSAGESWESRVEDILLHVFLHASFHRGQLVADLRQAGQEPPYVDYIHGVRTGMVVRRQSPSFRDRGTTPATPGFGRSRKEGD